MARVENTVRGARELNALTPFGPTKAKHFPIPGAVSVAGVVTNGSAEVPDAVLDELLAKDVCTQGWFKSGELIDTRTPSEQQEAKADAVEAAAKADADAAKAKATKGK